MELLLVNPYMLAADAEERRIMRPHPPLGILYLAAHLRRLGVDVGIFDGTFRTWPDFDDVLGTCRPPIVGIAANMMTKRNALRAIAASRAAGAGVIVGGPDPPHAVEEYLAAGADVVVIGEGEETLAELLPAMLRGARQGQLDRIAGIAFAAGGRVVRTAPRALMAGLDAQPFPAREAIDMSGYLDAWRRHHGFSVVSLITARGCPYTCAWCSRSVFGTSHRRRSPANVADEVQHIVDRYRPDRLWYADDVFAIHRQWTVTYAAELARRQLRLPFECISRAERIDDAVADALEAMGCWRVWIGSESGSQRVLDAMDRRTSVDRVREATRRLQRRGIQVGMFIMLGYDGERVSDIRATIDHLKRAAPDLYLTTVSYPIRGTPYHARLAGRLRTPMAWVESTDRDTVIRGRPVRRYYDFARRWIAGEVSRADHWKHGRVGPAARAAGAALVGRLGMAVAGLVRQR